MKRWFLSAVCFFFIYVASAWSIYFTDISLKCKSSLSDGGLADAGKRGVHV